MICCHALGAATFPSLKEPLCNVRFGSLTYKSSHAKIHLCPLWSNSGRTRVRLNCPLSAISGHRTPGLKWTRPPTEAAKTRSPGRATARASISGTIQPHAKLIPVTTNSTEWEKIRLPHTQKLNWITPKIQKGPVRGFTCLITNDATPKQIAAVKLIDSKGSHVTT